MKNLVWQHQKCDEQLSRVKAALQRWNLASAGCDFRSLNEQLEDHFRIDEERLFLAFEKISGMQDGSTVVKCGEHEEIHQLPAPLSSETRLPRLRFWACRLTALALCSFSLAHSPRIRNDVHTVARLLTYVPSLDSINDSEWIKIDSDQILSPKRTI